MEYKMLMNRPASWWGDTWREGTPLGNGSHGAMVYGSVTNERIMLTHTNLWRKGSDGTLPDVSDKLPEMRELIRQGKIAEADVMLTNAMKERGHNIKRAFPVPAADVNIYIKPQEGFTHYLRELSMDKAESVVSWRDGETKRRTKSFVSRADDVVVIETAHDAKISIGPHKSDAINDKNEYITDINIEVKTEADAAWHYYKGIAKGVEGSDTDKLEQGVVARVTKTADTTLIVCRVFYDGNHSKKWDEMREHILNLPNSYNELLSRHEPIHSELFSRCKFKLGGENSGRKMTNRQLIDEAYNSGLPNALVERMWAYGRYLLIISTGKDSLPCSLTSFFSGDYNAAWAFNMANINIEMTYWQALPGMLSEYMFSMFDYYDSNMDILRDCAKKLYGCRGIYICSVTSPGSLRAPITAPHIINWTAGAGWIAQHYYEYWLYTRDMDFLVNRALPFLRETALFYEDFLLWENENWYVCPSISPENHTQNYKGQPSNFRAQSSINATMDVAVIKEVFANLLAISKVVDLPEAETATWQKFLEGAPAYKYNPDGSPREWLDDDYPDNDFHRHQSHLYPVFPGLELSRAGADTLKAYRLGGIKRLTIGLEYQSSWAYAQNASLLARCGDGENALKSLWHIAKSSLMENFFTLHNDWRDMGLTLQMQVAPYQIDANMGWTSAVQEMLLYSDTDRIDILPALPKQWVDGEIGMLATRCGAYVSLKWGGDKVVVMLVSAYDTSFELYLPSGDKLDISLKKGEEKTLDFVC